MEIEPLSDYDLLPVYMRVADDLRAKLGTPGFDIGSYLPGEHEIATQYKLSRGTIRRALGILESDGLISRQPGRGTLILPSVTSKESTRPVIALVWTMVRWMGLDMFNALEEHLSAANCDIIFKSSKHNHQKEIEILTGLLNADVDAIVLYSTGHPAIHPLIQQLQNQGKPVVLLDRFVQDQSDSLSWVTSENEQGAYEITRHLIELGHTRIGMVIRTPEHERISTLVEREQGYVRAMTEAGLEILLMKQCGVPDDQLNTAAFGKDMFEFIDCRHPTALFFHNDASANRMYAVLKQNGIRVPEDISIAGFDGLNLFSDLLSFDLTTAVQDFAGMGQEVGKSVLSLLQTPARQSRQRRMTVKLSIGNTTAPPEKEASSLFVKG